jgi:hypothetical protein
MTIHFKVPPSLEEVTEISDEAKPGPAGELSLLGFTQLDGHEKKNEAIPCELEDIQGPNAFNRHTSENRHQVGADEGRDQAG